VAGRGVDMLAQDKPVPDSQEPIRIVLIEPQEVVREALVALLGAQAGLRVVEAATGAQAGYEACSTKYPDVVVTELALPSGSGFDMIRRLSALSRAPHIVVLSTFRFTEEVTGAFEAGAHACVSKAGSTDGLIAGIHAVMRGELYMSPAVSHLMLRAYASPHGTDGADQMPGRHLTRRETEILGFISHGRSDRETANVLGLSVKTVHTHRTNIMAKLGVRNVTMLIRRAIQLGIVHM